MTTVGRRTALARTRSRGVGADRRVVLGAAAAVLVGVLVAAVVLLLGWRAAVAVLQWAVAAAALLSAVGAGVLTWRWAREERRAGR